MNVAVANQDPNDAKPVFFPVSVTKLLALSVCTFGIYELFWSYKNWVLIKARENSEILPFWRAFFGYFFCYPLFAKVEDAPLKRDVRLDIPVQFATIRVTDSPGQIAL